MARPVKSDAERRVHVVAFRVTGAERATLMAKAATAGVEPSEFARLAALGESVRPARGRASLSDAPAIPFAVIDQLRRIGVNLNQYTRISYLGHDRTDEVGAAAHELREILADLRNVLDRFHGAER